MGMTCKKKIIREVDGKQTVKVIPAISDDYIRKHNLNHQEVVLLHLLNFGSITNNDCSDAYGYNNGERIICNLKENYGVTFNTIKQKSINRYFQKTDFVEYHITNANVYREALNEKK